MDERTIWDRAMRDPATRERVILALLMNEALNVSDLMDLA